MAVAPGTKPNRMPWIIAGVLGCLVVCLFAALAVVAAPLLLGVDVLRLASQTTPVRSPTQTPTRLPFGLVSATSTTLPFPTETGAPATQVVVPPTIVTLASPLPATPRPTAAPAATRPPASPTIATPPPAAQPTGKIVFSRCEDICDLDEKKSVWIVNADGTGAKRILTKASEPSLSPDGTKIAYYHWSDGIFVANLDGSDAKKVVGDTMVGFIDWSHDGRWIAFSAQPGGKGNIVIDVVPPDGSALKDSSARRNITVGMSPSWSPDDTQLVFSTCRTSCGIFKSGSAAGSAAIPITSDDGGLPSWSPDGKRLIYQKEIDGFKQLYVINADGSGPRQLTSGGVMHVAAVWSADGNYIYYRSPEGGPWGIWRINADGKNPIKIMDNVLPVDWAYERLDFVK